MSGNTVKVGVSERELERQGVEVESQSLLPAVPDFLGYILGLLLLWLGYTGYQMAVRVMEKPIAKISEEAETITATVQELATGKPVATAAPGLATSATGSPTESTGWNYRLDRLNAIVHQATEYVAGSASQWFSSDTLAPERRVAPESRVEQQRRRDSRSRVPRDR